MEGTAQTLEQDTTTLPPLSADDGDDGLPCKPLSQPDIPESPALHGPFESDEFGLPATDWQLASSSLPEDWIIPDDKYGLTSLQPSALVMGDQEAPSDPAKGGEKDKSDTDDRGQPAKKRQREVDLHSVRKKFSCPFYKHDSQKFARERLCHGPGWDQAHRVKYGFRIPPFASTVAYSGTLESMFFADIHNLLTVTAVWRSFLTHRPSWSMCVGHRLVLSGSGDPLWVSLGPR